MKYSRKLWLSVGVALLSMPSLSYAEDTAIYVIPDEAKCVVRKQDKRTYCTDKSGNAITGELRRYKDNTLYRLYPLKGGILEGTALTYYSDSTLKSEKPYTNGQLNGMVKEYYASGVLESETPYVNGKKEGIGKIYNEDGKIFIQMIYTKDKANGEMRVYSDNQILYSFINANDKISSGKYYYLSSQTPSKAIIKTKEIPSMIIDGLNSSCLEMQAIMSTSPSPVVLDESALAECNEQWRKENQTAVRKYLVECEKEKIDE